MPQGFDPFSLPVSGPAPTPAVPIWHCFEEFDKLVLGSSAAAGVLFVYSGQVNSVGADSTIEGGANDMTVDADDGDMGLLKLAGEPVKIAANRVTKLYLRASISDVDKVEFAFGLTDGAVTDPLDNTWDGVAMFTSTNDGVLDFGIGDGSNDDDVAGSGTDLATDDKIYEFGIEVWRKDFVRFYLDGELIKTLAIGSYNVPTDVLTPFIQLEAQGSNGTDRVINLEKFAGASYEC